MTYRQKDVFPSALPMRRMTIKEMVDFLEPTPEIPIVYEFGGGAPTAISLDNGTVVLEAIYAGALGTSPKAGVDGVSGRMFVEFDPYYWNPNGPTYAPV